jgi:OPA family glycerol-3-phosphate transporter-like MFS transporter 1/2
MLQATGWPCVIAIMGNYYGSGKRGLIFGIWQSNTAVGNILGNAIGSWGLKTDSSMHGHNWALGYDPPSFYPFN